MVSILCNPGIGERDATLISSGKKIIHSTGNRCKLFAAILLVYGVTSTLLLAQGTVNFTLLQTGGGIPLVSDSQTLLLDGSPALLTFDFGYYSDEIPAPNTFLDAFTVTVQDPSKTAVLVTTDANGPVWAPPTMGGVPLVDSDILRMVVAPPDASPVSGRGVGYSVTYSLSQFTGSSITIFFDLFDNQDPTGSLAWHTKAQLKPVPEPSLMSLCGLASLLFLIRRNQTHADRGP